MPKVSIIIPTYNSERFLSRAILSILNQTFSDFELIIVDDCSIDKTKEIINKFKEKDKRILSVFLDKNSGTPAYPKNIGFKSAKGKYIAYLDHDDEWLPQKLEKQLNLIEIINNKNIGIVSCNAIEINENNNQIAAGLSKKLSDFKNLNIVSVKNKSGEILDSFKQFKYESFFDVLINPNFYCGNNSVMIFSRETVNIIGPRDENIGAFEDTDIIFRIAEMGYDFYFVDESLCKIYSHGGNFTKNYAYLGEKEALSRGKQFSLFVEKYNSYYEKIQPFLYSDKMRGIGILYMLGGDYKEARNFFKKAIKIYSYDFKNYINFFLSFLGKDFYQKIFLFKK